MRIAKAQIKSACASAWPSLCEYLRISIEKMRRPYAVCATPYADIGFHCSFVRLTLLRRDAALTDYCSTLSMLGKLQHEISSLHILSKEYNKIKMSAAIVISALMVK